MTYGPSPALPGPPPPPPSQPYVGLGLRTDTASGAQSVSTQSPPPPCLPSSSLGLVFPRVSDAPFGGPRDALVLSQRCLLPRVSASSSPPLARPQSGAQPQPPGANSSTPSVWEWDVPAPRESGHRCRLPGTVARGRSAPALWHSIPQWSIESQGAQSSGAQ